MDKNGGQDMDYLHPALDIIYGGIHVRILQLQL